MMGKARGKVSKVKLLSHPESESDHSNVDAQNFANFRPGA